MATNIKFQSAFEKYLKTGSKKAWRKMFLMHNNCEIAKEEYKDEYAAIGFWYHEPEPEGWWDDWGSPADKNQMNETEAR